MVEKPPRKRGLSVDMILVSDPNNKDFLIYNILWNFHWTRILIIRSRKLPFKTLTCSKAIGRWLGEL